MRSKFLFHRVCLVRVAGYPGIHCPNSQSETQEDGIRHLLTSPMYEEAAIIL